MLGKPKSWIRSRGQHRRLRLRTDSQGDGSHGTLARCVIRQPQEGFRPLQPLGTVSASSRRLLAGARCRPAFARERHPPSRAPSRRRPRIGSRRRHVANSFATGAPPPRSTSRWAAGLQRARHAQVRNGAALVRHFTVVRASGRRTLLEGARARKDLEGERSPGRTGRRVTGNGDPALRPRERSNAPKSASGAGNA